jgi:hypothetical protein
VVNEENPVESNRPRALWAYGYKLSPPVARRRLAGVEKLLKAGHDEARTASQVWEGRLINGSEITHILVVSSSPSHDREVNHKLEAEFLRLDAGYSITASVEVVNRRPRPAP